MVDVLIDWLISGAALQMCAGSRSAPCAHARKTAMPAEMMAYASISYAGQSLLSAVAQEPSSILQTLMHDVGVMPTDHEALPACPA